MSPGEKDRHARPVYWVGLVQCCQLNENPNWAFYIINILKTRCYILYLIFILGMRKWATSALRRDGLGIVAHKVRVKTPRIRVVGMRGTSACHSLLPKAASAISVQ